MVEVHTKELVRDSSIFQGLGVMVSIRQGDTVETEFGIMVDTIYEWYERYGNTLGEIVVNFVTPQEHEENLLAYFMSLIQQEETLRPLFLQLGHIYVTFIRPDGTNKKDLDIEIS